MSKSNMRVKGGQIGIKMGVPITIARSNLTIMAIVRSVGPGHKVVLALQWEHWLLNNVAVAARGGQLCDRG